ncbi:RND family efflux transporter MFP subunit [Formosa agariphila KMM 3901]|uniref:RND family efflux transporter MFP subunit n=1 Tax=Formosa agariphila (strain DSM 15362 / KCTC 12365 / LMG 23005 / KMM 3901 / M-2Alg 35-1) TaxID=1347342 RepID=T2KJG5_FORAG|nr:efflux RND transporter periplasmic adaptor subunit [Formosa agariphila]CDF78910.1 RND family efflux transporter MFP subunit [Formosa agariphila KMM 3901]
MKKLIYISVFTLLTSVLSCGSKDTKSNETVNDVETSEAKHEDHGEHEEAEGVHLKASQFQALQMKVDTLSNRLMSGYVEANGTLEVPPQNEASVTTIIGANIASIEVIEGDKVAKGQVVAYLTHPNIIKMQTDYLNAYSNSMYLKKNFERQKKLYDSGVGSGANFQKAEAEYEASKALANGLGAQLQLLQLNPESIQNGTIYQRVGLRTPIEGFVQKVNVKTGQYVAPETEVFEIVNTHHVHADLMVFEKDVQHVKKGQKVRFTVQSFLDDQLMAEIYSVSKTFEENPKAVHVHAEIKNDKGHLIPGMYIKGKIQINEIASLAIPEHAIFKEGNRFFVFKAEQEAEEWKFEPLEVIPGAKDEGWQAVTFLETQAESTKFALNNAYYLSAEMKKGESEHSH